VRTSVNSLRSKPGNFPSRKLFEEEERPLGMQTGNSSSTAARQIGEGVEDALRNAVEIALAEFKVATHEQKSEAARRLIS
jgi:hypothetical protein